MVTVMDRVAWRIGCAPFGIVQLKFRQGGIKYLLFGVLHVDQLSGHGCG